MIAHDSDTLHQPAMQYARIRFRDLKVVDSRLKRSLLEAVDRMLSSGQLLMGPEVERFEARFAGECGRKYCVGVASGTSALYLALRALGIGHGDEVITTPMSWIATLNAIHLCGAKPVFVDVTADQNINSELIEASLTLRTKAILPVHFTGRLCDMRRIGEIARAHKLLVIEDAAQAYGARRGGIPAGGYGTAAAFSLNPMKTFGAYGEAGAVVTDDTGVREKLVAMRSLGTVEKEVCHYPELNHKIDELQAAMLMVSYEGLAERLEARLEQVNRYNCMLGDVVEVPRVNDHDSVFFDYQILAPHRDELRAYLAGHGIETKIKHPLLMDQHPAYSHLRSDRLPVARRLVKLILSLPLHQFLRPEEQDEISARIHEFYAGRR